MSVKLSLASFGVKPVLGRMFLPEENGRAGPRAVVLFEWLLEGSVRNPAGNRRPAAHHKRYADGRSRCLAGHVRFRLHLCAGGTNGICLPYFVDGQTDAIGDEA